MTPDELRGHDWFPSEDDLGRVPSLYATESTPLDEKIVHLHYFTGACDWWVVELGEDRRIAFGYVNLGDVRNAEWGYIDLVELRKLLLLVQGMPVWVERDLDWTPRKFGEVR